MNRFNPAVLGRRAVALMALGGATTTCAGETVVFFETFDPPMGPWASAHINDEGGLRQTGGNPGACFVLNEFGQPHLDPQIFRVVSGLTPGRKYRLEGDYKDRFAVCTDATTISFRIDVDSISVFAGTRALQWTHFSCDWISSASSAVVRIRAETDGTDCDAAVDNIKLTEVLPCLSDISGDYQVDGVDLAMVLSAWGLVNSPANIDRSASSPEVDGQDLAFVLSGWGPCP